MGDMAGRKVFKVFNQDFVVDDRYTVTKELGQGAYGIVCAATNNTSNEGVAIKKVTNVFSKKILAKRALREIKLLQHFRGHRNITCLYDMDIPRPDNFNETYLYEELMECDLAAIIRSGQPLTDAHFQSFIYQILCGLKYIHSANVLHRDLKPGNLLVNADCELKIADFGLARGFSIDPEENAGYMTEYVATRWYRAPEIMLSFQSYTKAIDVWSVGCILAELLGGRPFFKGRDYVDQLNQILHYLGTPNEETLSRIGSPRAQEYVRNLPFMPKVPFQRLFPQANPDALDLLDRMLAFDPSSRISVEEALEHRYLHIWHDASDEPACPQTFEFAFEVVEDVQEMRKMILDEVVRFRAHVRQQPQTPSSGGMAQNQQGNVPIPDNANQWGAQDPRPQETGAHTGDELENALLHGMDMRRELHLLNNTTVPAHHAPATITHSFGASPERSDRQILPVAPISSSESLTSLPAGWNETSSPQGNLPLTLQIAVTQRNQAHFEQRVLDISTPSHPPYGQHLKQEEVKGFLQPAKSATDAILSWLSSSGVANDTVENDGAWIQINVTVTQAEGLFKTKFYEYKYGSTTVIRTQQYSIPVSLHSDIQMIHPTIQFPTMRSQIHAVSSADNWVVNTTQWNAWDPVFCNTTITPACLRGLYGLENTSAYQIIGNSIGISGYEEQYPQYADLSGFFTQLAPNANADNFTVVSINGGLDTQELEGNNTKEANLDIQYALALSYPTKTI